MTENFVPPFFHFEDNQDPHDPAAHSDQERPRGMSLRQKMIIDRCLDEYNRSQSKFITIQMNQYNEMVPPNERVAIPSRNCIRNYINYQKQLKKRKRGDVAKSEVV